MEIGEPQREVTYEPLEDPFRKDEPAREPEPVKAPVEEPVHASAECDEWCWVACPHVRQPAFTGGRA